MPDAPMTRQEALALLEWQIAMGANEAIGETARDWLSPAPAAEPALSIAAPPGKPVSNHSSPSPLPNPPPLAGEGRVGVLPPRPDEGRTDAAARPAPSRVSPPSALAESPA